MSVHFSSMKGRRRSNEDTHTIKPFMSNKQNPRGKYARVNIYSIFDGHGGTYVSKYLRDHLHKYFVNKKVQYPVKRRYISDTFSLVQQKLTKGNPNMSRLCGSTCLFIMHFVDKDGTPKIQVANVGDSRACICHGTTAVQLTTDHKPGTQNERMRIAQLGGKVVFDGADWRVGNLSVSRAFGDNDTKPFVVQTPDIFNHKLNSKDRFIILGCDGLWDVIKNQDAVNFVLQQCYDKNTGRRLNKLPNIAARLASHAINNLKSTDNVSVIVVFLD